MSYTKAEKTVARCSSCGEIHTVKIKSDGSVFLIGIGLLNQCPCGESSLERLHVDLDSQVETMSN